MTDQQTSNEATKAYEDFFEKAHDGIKEFDNPLPGWWTWLFILSVVFSVGYVAWYHIGVGASIEEKYDTQVATFYEGQLAQLGITEADDLNIIRLTENQELMVALAGMFNGQCAQCHRTDGGGGIGPNLTDDHWKNVKTPSDIFAVITDGVDGTAMSSWERRLREPQRILLSAYVAYLRSTTVSDGKAVEGVLIDPWPTVEELEAAQPETGDEQARRDGGDDAEAS